MFSSLFCLRLMNTNLSYEVFFLGVQYASNLQSIFATVSWSSWRHRKALYTCRASLPITDKSVATLTCCALFCSPVATSYNSQLCLNSSQLAARDPGLRSKHFGIGIKLSIVSFQLAVYQSTFLYSCYLLPDTIFQDVYYINYLQNKHCQLRRYPIVSSIQHNNNNYLITQMIIHNK